MLTEQEKAWLERRKSPCLHCSNHGVACGYSLSEKATCEWLVHNGCPMFDPPCAYLDSSNPYPYMTWKETGGECPHIPHRRGYCNRWCKLMTARLVVEQEMEKQQ